MKIYIVYWREKEHEKYLEQVDRKNHLFFFLALDHDGHFTDNIVDESVDVEKIVVLVGVCFRRTGFVAVGILCRSEGRTHSSVFARCLVNKVRFFGTLAQGYLLEFDASISIFAPE